MSSLYISNLALLVRLRGSLTCEGGLQPDHVMPQKPQHSAPAPAPQFHGGIASGGGSANSGGAGYTPEIFQPIVFYNENKEQLYEANIGPGKISGDVFWGLAEFL